jgi:CBS domain containing-hemolysin-like protein
MEAEERVMLKNILKLGEIHVDDVMVPRADIVGVDVETGLKALVALFRRASHSRLPVFSGTLDTVLGMTHIKDLPEFWNGGGEFSLRRIVREVLFVPPSMRAMDLMQKMRESRIHMAVVVDEFGGTDGLVTIEDLVEEIVGEIEDEHDRVLTPVLTANPDGSFQADGRLPVEALEAKAGVALLTGEAEEEIETLGGLVFSLVGRVPNRGERIAHPCGIEFEVLDADPRRIKRLKVRMPPPAGGEATGSGGPPAAE